MYRWGRMMFVCALLWTRLVYRMSQALTAHNHPRRRDVKFPPFVSDEAKDFISAALSKVKGDPMQGPMLALLTCGDMLIACRCAALRCYALMLSLDALIAAPPADGQRAAFGAAAAAAPLDRGARGARAAGGRRPGGIRSRLQR